MGSACGPVATTGTTLKANSPNCPTGRCGLKLDGLTGKTYEVYIDQTYDGGGWVMVINNTWVSGGMRNLTYSDAVNSVNYRVSEVPVTTIKNKTIAQFNAFLGVKYWFGLCQNITPGYMYIVQFVSSSAKELNDTGNHTKRYRWRSTQFTGTYQFQAAGGVSDETGTGAPGLLTYHAANQYNLTTYDNDQDPYAPINCSQSYGNNPWWYGACWSGSYYGYDNGVYWDGSSSDSHSYGAVYIK